MLQIQVCLAASKFEAGILQLRFHKTGVYVQEGKAHAYNLGRLLRRRYGCFLGAELTPELVAVRSTVVPRAQHSAALVMAGLVPPAPNQRWAREAGANASLGQLWQPVLLDTVPRTKEAVSISTLLFFFKLIFLR